VYIIALAIKIDRNIKQEEKYMDRMTRFEMLKENGNVVGFRIDPQGTTEDEYFCLMLPRNLNQGKASITASGGKLIIDSSGVGGREKFIFRVSGEEEKQLQAILSGLGEYYQGHCKLGGFGGRSLTVSFKKIGPLNEREKGKRKRSVWRKPIRPKNPAKIEEWEKIYT